MASGSLRLETAPLASRRLRVAIDGVFDDHSRAVRPLVIALVTRLGVSARQALRRR
jgi:hypothetical protein